MGEKERPGQSTQQTQPLSIFPLITLT
uniref:Uncharacterized protein n=1 Tax=Arundo donax TaxID=35708 RepID=A0A0A9ELJ5_ARUDO